MALINRTTLTMNNQSDLFFNRLSSVISSTFIRSLFVIRYICKYQNTFFFSVCYNRCSGKTAFIYFAPCYCWFWQSVCSTCEINVCTLQNWAVVWRSYGNCWNYYNEDIEQLVLVIVWFRVQFGKNMHEWLFQKRTKLHESEGRVQFVFLKNSWVHVFPKFHEKPYYYLIIICI